MMVLNCKIYIGNHIFKFVNNVEVSTSWKEQVDTCKITLPGNIKIDKRKISETFKVGDKVSISVGYDGHFGTIFKGFVSKVGAKIPVVIDCEDNMWKLKQEVFSTSGKMTLKDFLNANYTAFKFKSIEMDLGSIEINNENKAKALSLITEKFGVKSFFRDETLICGLQYDLETAKKIPFNIKRNTADDLEFVKAESVKVKIKAISNLSDGKKLEVETGESGGEEKTLNFYNITDKNTLLERAKEELKKWKYDGFRGSITTLGKPLFRHGDIIILKDDERNDRAGSYYIDQVDYSFGVNGFSQKLYLGIKV